MCIHQPGVRRACCDHLCAACWWLYACIVAVVAYMVFGSVLLSGLEAIASGFFPSALYSTVSADDSVGVEVLLKQKHSPDSPAALGVPFFGAYLYSQTPLALCAFQDRPKIAKILLDAGADPNRGRLQGPLGTISAESPLFGAAIRGNYAVLKELLRGGATPSVGQSAGPLGVMIRETPLAAAAARGYALSVTALIEAGADPNGGWTFASGFHVSALALAVDSEHIPVMHALLSGGADPELGRSYFGIYSGTPLYYAARDEVSS